MTFKIGQVARCRGGVRRCGYKQKHWTYQAAGRHLDSLLSTLRGRGVTPDPMNIYRCKQCGAWHLGRRKVT